MFRAGAHPVKLAVVAGTCIAAGLFSGAIGLVLLHVFSGLTPRPRFGLFLDEFAVGIGIVLVIVGLVFMVLAVWGVLERRRGNAQSPNA
jgi:ABC-type uncharacterized transport system YnjBCD permease subunit